MVIFSKLSCGKKGLVLSIVNFIYHNMLLFLILEIKSVFSNLQYSFYFMMSKCELMKKQMNKFSEN